MARAQAALVVAAAGGRISVEVARERAFEAFVTEHRSAIDLAFSLDQDQWNGERYLQLEVADFRAPEG